MIDMTPIAIMKVFDAMPVTAEKTELIRQYTSDEICSFDFYCDAKDYIELHSNESVEVYKQGNSK